jgi:hypothetical protein
MIREAVETLGPPGILPSQDAVLEHYGPEPVHEAAAIVEALQRLFGRGQKRPTGPASSPSRSTSAAGASCGPSPMCARFF